MHYMTDDPPYRGNYVEPFYQAPFTQNLTGEPSKYVPYSTTTPKILKFQPGPQRPDEIRAGKPSSRH